MNLILDRVKFPFPELASGTVLPAVPAQRDRKHGAVAAGIVSDQYFGKCRQ